ncbi:Dolichyl-phosphate beta-D-mannosyltransferase [Pyrobaculum islandicum DSM 4184]|uniref:Dolichol-phosphate mannosyltransferase n=1 Tax=Pyrobaculum islandicum (strain DSM 4184 / JCM 9189 / GEO3) TaxID=384616 RepID=A1RUZ4_PYRIL|nr:glycosyltransferase [Pyrobaculum islandicum]ABL88776.1 Dolichyl-phosphate beta-D-mannosyltransferase [Pyrobaculum islandicum DSM 4184]
MISVIVPTYNEAENIRELVERLHKALGSNYEVVIVDDNSLDGTVEVAKSLAKKYPVKVVTRKNRLGLSSAVAEGAKWASGDVVVVMDADLQHPPELVPKLAEIAERGCLAVASRYVKGGGVRGWSLYRRIVSKGAVFLARLLLPEARAVRDPVSGFFAYSRECLAQIKPTGLYKILLDVLVQCKPRCVVEVPYIFGLRTRGRSKLGTRHMLDYLRQLLRLSKWRPLKFAAVGASGVFVAWAVLYLLSPLPPYLSVAAAIETSLTSNYLLNRLWTFAERKTPALIGWLRYHVATAAGNATNYITTLALNILGVWVYIAYLIGVIAGYAVNYILSELTVFMTSPSSL